MWFKKKQVRIKLLPEITESIFNDFYRWYTTENATYLKNPDNKPQDSTCVNIALLEPNSFLSDIGKARVDYLFGDKSPVQATARRMKALYSQFIVKYDNATIEEFKLRCLESLSIAYNIDIKFITALNNTYNTFWMFPMFKRAFENSIVESK